MASVKLVIDGRRVVADSSQTILEAARANGIDHIPTLCNDRSLEPFASCFVCVVKVKGAKSLLPSCATKVAPGMVVETDTPEVRKSRKAALELLLSNHYADCVGPCQVACPAGVDIQGYIALAAIGKYRDAVALVKERNPLPSVCGRVCTRPCEVKGCRRTLLDEAVGIDYIKRYISDVDLGQGDAFLPEVAPANGHRVAIVGAGPSGLSAAYYLALKGCKVDVYEALPEAGGMLRYGIPEYRLPKDVLDLEIGQILALGVTLKTNRVMGRDFTVKSLKEDGYGAVYVAIGAWQSSRMQVAGEDIPGVMSGIGFLADVGLKKKVELKGTVLVVGGGNTAIDCARTALRTGASEVRIVYRRTRNEMPANKTEIEDAEAEGVKMDFLVAPVRVVSGGARVTGLECQRMELGAPDASGRRSPKPVKGSEFVMDCDVILAAIGQATTVPGLLDGRVKGFLPDGERLDLTRWQTIQAAESSGETSVEGVFAGGDVVTGAATAIEAIAAGRKAAHAIDAYLTGGQARPEPVEFFSRKDTFRKVSLSDLRGDEKAPRQHMPMLPPAERIRSFVEVELGITPDQLHSEVKRCLECGCTALFDCDLRRYATEYAVDVKRFLGEARSHRIDRTHPLLELDQNKCILCGRCVRMCSEVVGVSAYGYVHRGFNTVVKPALDGSLLDTGCVSCGLCASTCPTGAVEERVQLGKPGPWRTGPVPTVCAACGVGCRLDRQVYGDTLVKTARSGADAPTAGLHCRKGFFGHVHVHAPERLTRAWLRDADGTRDVAVDEALEAIAARVKALAPHAGPAETAVFVSPRLTNEEAYAAQKLARVALKTHNVGSLALLANEAFACPDVLSDATLDDLGRAGAVLAVATAPDTEHFVAGLHLRRAIREGGKLVWVAPEASGTGALAEVHVACRPGTEAAAVLAIAAAAAALRGTPLPAGLGGDPEALAAAAGAGMDDVRAAAGILAGAASRVVLCNRDWRGPRAPGDVRLYADVAAALGARFLGLHEKANMQGVLDMGAHPAWFPGYRPVGDAVPADLETAWGLPLDGIASGGGLGELLRQRRLRVVVVLGEDPLGSPDVPEDLKAGLRAADLLVAADLFPTATTAAAHVVLPLSDPAETSGTYTNSERRVQRLARAVPPRAGVETWEVLARLGTRLGARFRMAWNDPQAIFEEIRQVAPIYRDVEPDGPGARAIWDAGRFALPRCPSDGVVSAPAGLPVATHGLDAVDARFAAWYDGLLDRARAARSG